MEDYKENKLQIFFEFLPNVLDTELGAGNKAAHSLFLCSGQ